MTTLTSARHSLSTPPLSRRTAMPAALALLAVAVVHLIDGPGSLTDGFYIGALELALAAACVPLAVLLATWPVRLLWHAAGALCTAALLVYVASRTTGLPGSSDDIGHWWQTLGVLAVAFEAAVIALAAFVVRPKAPRQPSDHLQTTTERVRAQPRIGAHRRAGTLEGPTTLRIDR